MVYCYHWGQHPAINVNFSNQAPINLDARRTAVEEVRIKTPPSGLALKVGKAALKR
jgi:hypothetical protein